MIPNRQELIDIILRAAEKLEAQRSQPQQEVKRNTGFPAFKINQNLTQKTYEPRSKDVPEDPSKDSKPEG